MMKRNKAFSREALRFGVLFERIARMYMQIVTLPVSREQCYNLAALISTEQNPKEERND
jgi:hypothetical protein